jgi:hypothetical protein
LVKEMTDGSRAACEFEREMQKKKETAAHLNPSGDWRTFQGAESPPGEGKRFASEIRV